MEEKCKQYKEGYNLGMKHGTIKSLRDMVGSTIFPNIKHEERYKITFQAVCVELQESMECVNPTSENDLRMYLLGYVDGKNKKLLKK